MDASETPCCDEYARLSRRGLFRGAAAMAGATTAFGGAVLTASPASALTPARSVLVVVSLRGAADGLSLVVPHGDPVYYRARPRIAIPADQLLARDGFFGLHPKLAPLLPLWRAGSLAAVHATGLPAPNRSHFAAMEELEDAAPGSDARVGWLNRLIGLDAVDSPLQGVSLTGSLPTSLYGPESAMSATSVPEVKVAADDRWVRANGRMRSLQTLWGRAGGDLGSGARAAFRAVGEFAPVLSSPAGPAHGASYPGGDLGDALAGAARIVKADLGVQVVTVDHGDWDMHSGLGTLSWGRMNSNAEELARALAAFFTDIGRFDGDPVAQKVTVVVLSEFGRRVQENSNHGLDHGYGNVMLLAGAGVRGGYHGRWPGLVNDLNADLAVTTDYRSVLAEVVSRRFDASTATVFPGFAPASVGAML